MCQHEGKCRQRVAKIFHRNFTTQLCSSHPQFLAVKCHAKLTRALLGQENEERLNKMAIILLPHHHHPELWPLLGLEYSFEFSTEIDSAKFSIYPGSPLLTSQINPIKVVLTIFFLWCWGNEGDSVKGYLFSLEMKITRLRRNFRIFVL